MRKLQTNRVAVVTAAVGTLLMILPLVWRINPVEGSVVPTYLTSNPAGVAVVWILLVTCMPAWISGVLLAHAIPMVNPYNRSGWIVACCLMCIVQFMLYLGLGHVCSRIVRKGKRRFRTAVKE